MRIIPAIDLQDGKCVRLYQDLDGARTGAQQNRGIIASIAAKTDMSVQVGGGIRDKATVQAWLDSGVTRCVIGSLAITEPDAVKSWLVQFGGDHIVLALDVNIDGGGVPLITTHGWTAPSNTSVFECIEDYAGLGLRHVLCTDVSRDGAMAGPNYELYEYILGRFPELQLLASGGVRDIRDLEMLRDQGVPAAITGRALLDGTITAEELVSFRQNV